MKDLMDKTIQDILELLIEHREFLHNNGGNTNAISYIDDDIDMIGVAYFGSEPDGDHQEEVAETGLKLTFHDAFDILLVRMNNSGLFDR
jgi:hypothetical protein